MPYILLTPPAVEPVSLNEAKAHLRVDITDDDTLIGALISAARTHAEMVTQRQFVTATWKLVLDAFPGPSLMGVPSGMPFSMPAHAIQLNKSPVQSVISVNYLDMGGTMQTMPPADYKVDISTEPARITPVFGKIWPVTLPQIGSVEITFTAGYGTLDNSTPPVWVPQQVPEGIKAWMKIRMATLYENREEIALMSRGKLEPLPYVDGLLDPFRIVSY
jgi:uncharacterized phiE125 gp8 family phage protein